MPLQNSPSEQFFAVPAQTVLLHLSLTVHLLPSVHDAPLLIALNTQLADCLPLLWQMLIRHSLLPTAEHEPAAFASNTQPPPTHLCQPLQALPSSSGAQWLSWVQPPPQPGFAMSAQ